MIGVVGIVWFCAVPKILKQRLEVLIMVENKRFDLWFSDAKRNVAIVANRFRCSLPQTLKTVHPEHKSLSRQRLLLEKGILRSCAYLV
jgi:hypothetical protein